MFVLSMFICFAMICACQKQDSAAEAQLAQRKTELDAREKALDEREKAVSRKGKSRSEQSYHSAAAAGSQPRGGGSGQRKAITTAPSGASCADSQPAQMDSAKLAKEREAARQGQTSDPEQAKAERERRIQQLPPELQALIRDRSLLDARTAEKSTATEDRAVELQRRLEEARRKKMSAIASPNAESSDTQPSSPSPSPTPE